MSNINKNIDKNYEENPEKSLLAMIDNNIADVDVPEGLKPDNMMKHIRQLKSEGYFEEKDKSEKTEESEKAAMEEYIRRKNIRRVKKMATALATVAAACVILFVPFGGSKDNPNGSYQSIVDSVKVDDGNGNYVLSGYKELSQYAVASGSLERKYEVEAKSLFERFVEGFSYTSDDVMSEEWEGNSGAVSEDLSGDIHEYSSTNVRTEGIDEADIIKTDGEYIYYIEDQIGKVQLVIAKADGENTEILSETNVDYSIFKDYEMYAYDELSRFSTRELFVYGDKVVMLMSGIVGGEKSREYGYIDIYRTTVLTYDVENPAEPQLISQNELDGMYESGRMVDGYIYLFTYVVANLNLEDKSYTEQAAMEIIAPKANGEYIEPEQIYVAENSDYDTFKIIATLDVNKPESFKDINAVLGSGYELNSYVSNEYIYFLSNINYSMVEVTGDAEIAEYKNQAEILKFSYNDGLVVAEDREVIDGAIGDEFDIDEYNGYLRVAITKYSSTYTTTKKKYTFFDGEEWFDCEMSEGDIFESWEQYSAIYILDENLDMVSELILKRDESVYGVRFDGDVAYVVTFRETDPLFAVDLSDPMEPKVMSALKIPGFSTYLHKWDDNTLVGIGYVASTNSALKISTFDISDKYDIIEENVCKLPSNGRSKAPLNHKAIFISPEKNLIGLWLTGTFMVEDTSYPAMYALYSYVDGELTEVLRCPLTNRDSAQDTRGMYIGEYIYIYS